LTAAELNTLINFKCRTNDTTFALADKLYLVNFFKDEIASLIVEKNAGYFLIPTTFDLVGDQREYTFEDDQLNRMHKLEIKFAAADARQPSNFIKDYGGSETESEIVKYFTNSKGGFAHIIRRRGLLILSGTIVAVTAGGRLWWHKYPANLANLTDTTGLEVDPSTTTFGFPRQLHELLARRVSIEYKGRQPKPIPLNDMDKRYQIDLDIQLAAMATIDNSGEIIGEFPLPQDIYNDGWSL